MKKSAIFELVKANKIAELKAALENISDINSIKSKNNRSLLFHAIVNSNKNSDAIVELLLSKGAMADSSSLIYQAASISLKCTELIHTSHQTFIINLFESSSITPSEIISISKKMILEPYNFTTDEIVDFAATKLSSTPFYSIFMGYFDASSYALTTGSHSLEITTYLLKSGVKVNFSGDKNPLVPAILDGDREVVKLLIENNVDVNSIATYTNSPSINYPIEAAIHQRDDLLVEMLLKAGLNFARVMTR